MVTKKLLHGCVYEYLCCLSIHGVALAGVAPIFLVPVSAMSVICLSIHGVALAGVAPIFLVPASAMSVICLCHSWSSPCRSSPIIYGACKCHECAVHGVALAGNAPLNMVPVSAMSDI